MSQSMRVYVFGDQAFDVGDLLLKLLEAREDGLVHEFFEEVADVLQQETALLEPEKQSLSPQSTKVADLVPLWQAGTLNPALSQALTCACHLGTFMFEHGSASSWTYPGPENACLTGLCTGTLAAVAVSCATNLSELLPLALHTVRYAFRVGACAWDCASRLSAVHDDSWTAAVSVEPQDDLAASIANFVADKALPDTDVPYISAWIGPSRASICGPPQVLDSLLATEPLKSRLLARLRIRAPYHAPHLFSESTISQLSSPPMSSMEPVEWPSTAIPIVSSVTGQRNPAMRFPDGLNAAAQDCLRRIMRLDLLPVGLATHLKATNSSDFVVVPFAAATPDRLKQFISACLGPTALPALPAASAVLSEKSATVLHDSPTIMPKSEKCVVVITTDELAPQKRATRGCFGGKGLQAWKGWFASTLTYWTAGSREASRLN